jgi:hypothetical protein
VGTGTIPIADDGIRLRAFLAFNDVELDVVAFFERFVPIQLNCRVVDEYIRPVIPSDESVALGVVEPLNLSLVLSHRFLPSFCSCLSPYVGTVSMKGNFPPILDMTQKTRERLIKFLTIREENPNVFDCSQADSRCSWAKICAACR